MPVLVEVLMHSGLGTSFLRAVVASVVSEQKHRSAHPVEGPRNGCIVDERDASRLEQDAEKGSSSETSAMPFDFFVLV